MSYLRLLWVLVFSVFLVPVANAGFFDKLSEKLSKSVSDPRKLEKKCRKGDADFCAPAGNAYRYGKEIPLDLAKAAELFSLGCRGGDFASCKSLHGIGRQYRDGEEVAEDKVRALELFLLACEGDPARAIHSALACASAGNLKYRGDGVAKDQRGAVALYQRGCDHGSYYSCKQLADELFSGKVVARNYARAAVAYAKACHEKHPNVQACTRAGTMHLHGQGVSIDPARAAVYFERGCRAPDNHGRSCFELGKLYHQGVLKSAEPDIVVTLYRQACRLSDYEWPEACLAVARLYQNGDTVERDPNMEREYYNYGCLRKLKEACRLRCEISCRAGQYWGCQAIKTGNIPIGVPSCISDAGQMVSPEMQKVLEDYWKSQSE